MKIIFKLMTIISILGAVAMFVNPNFEKVLSFFNFYQATEIQGFKWIEQLVQTHWIGTNEEVALPLNPLVRFLLITPAVIVVEFVVGFLRFKKIQFK